ncbi:unnamed protein product [Psylliodes chrysocephalus]|uniref:Uncharacterized protein n=1 Tax=Psylliodes chrysocephalus TaxID=3402493 RepID=A0A9P0D0W2_9CUCU|nr:unnamed protein product [Psylliodes chrysocephala]
MNKENVPKTPKRVRFTYDDDLALLREVVNINPLKDLEKWKEVGDVIQAVTGKCFTLRSLKDHLHLLLEIWKKKDTTNVGKSGIEEIYSEKDNLLQEVADICRELNITMKAKKPKISRNDKIIVLGKESRASTSAAFFKEIASHDDSFVIEDEQDDNIFQVNMHDYCIEGFENEISLVDVTIPEENKKPPANNENTAPTCDAAKPNKQKKPKLRAVRKDAMQFVENRNAKEHAIKKIELDFQERKLNLEERRMQLEEERFKLEKEERQFKMKLETEKFLYEKNSNNNQQSLIEKQNKMIDLLINKFQPYDCCFQIPIFTKLSLQH